MKKKDIGILIRTLVLVFALINQALVLAGYSPLPFSDQEVEAFVTSLFTIGSSVWVWWKDQDISHESRDKKKFIDENYKK